MQGFPLLAQAVLCRACAEPWWELGPARSLPEVWLLPWGAVTPSLHPLPERLSPDSPTAHPAALGPWWGQPLHLPDRIIPGLVLQLGKLSAALN